MYIYFNNPQFMLGILTAIAGLLVVVFFVTIGTILSEKFRNFVKNGIR